MDVESMEAPPVPEEKPAVKMEEFRDRIEGLLLPLFPELDDSGIDSDSTELMASSARLLNERNGLFSDASSSDEDPMAMPWWQGVNHNKAREEDDILKAIEEGRVNPLDVNWPMGHQRRTYYGALEADPDRSSPPLYEVELTASEEDDDTSVLELVIPMQSSRYKRVPTASPKKAKPKAKPKAKLNRTFYYSFICCMRK